MASKNLSDEDIEALKTELKKTNRTTLIIDRITLGLAWAGLFVALVFGVIGTIWPNTELVVTALTLAVLSLWARSGVAQDRIKRLELGLALHLLGATLTDPDEVE